MNASVYAKQSTNCLIMAQPLSCGLRGGQETITVSSGVMLSSDVLPEGQAADWNVGQTHWDNISFRSTGLDLGREMGVRSLSDEYLSFRSTGLDLGREMGVRSLSDEYLYVVVATPRESATLTTFSMGLTNSLFSSVGSSRLVQLEEGTEDYTKAVSPVLMQPVPPELEERFRQISELPHDWNSYGAQPISPESIERARYIASEGWKSGLPVPGVAPGSGGSMSIEWETSRGELIIEIEPGKDTTYLLILEGNDEETEGMLTDHNFSSVLSRLTGFGF
jgi:hypothetical protein